MRTTTLAALALVAACSSGSQGTAPAAPAPASAEAPATTAACPLERGTMVLNTNFTNSGERAGITLQAGCVYWATTNIGGVQLTLRPRVSGTAMPYMAQQMGAGVAGGSTWEIRANVGGEYEIWASGLRAGTPVKVEVTIRGSLSKPS